MAKTANLKIVKMAPQELIENPYQPQWRTDDKAIKVLMNSIRDRGVLVPIAVTEEYVILDGHRRRESSVLLDLKTVPVVVHPGLTPEDFGLLNKSTKPIGSAGWVEAFVRSKGVIKEMPRQERGRCEELLRIFGTYRELDRWFVKHRQGSNNLKYINQITNLFAVSEKVKTFPSKKQIGMWMIHHNLAWVCRNLIKDLLKGKSSNETRLKKLARKISRNEAIDDEF